MRIAAFLRICLAGLSLLIANPAAALDVQELRSPGGAGFWLVEEPSIPIVSVNISFAGGARLDPEGKEGLSNLFAGLLGEGAGDLDAIGFSEARDAISARFGFGANSDEVSVSARMLSDAVEPSVDLLALALTAPRFDPEPLERTRAQVLAGIAESGEDPSAVASRTWFSRAFPEHSYGRPNSGTAESVAALSRDDLLAAHSRLLTRANARIAIVGAIGAESAGQIVDKLMAGLPEGEPLPARRADTPPPPGLTVVSRDVPQSAAIFGQAGLDFDDPDFMAAYVMNYVLGGGGFVSRLMTEVREKRGLAYGVTSYLHNLDEAAIYLGRVQTENARIAET
ncbi:MAG TPA: pitrilysin family protein, partial [Thermohalobaculum sp.]|nr:pitrilysin family protein [Thermohalobaculum sp.]